MKKLLLGLGAVAAVAAPVAAVVACSTDLGDMTTKIEAKSSKTEVQLKDAAITTKLAAAKDVATVSSIMGLLPAISTSTNEFVSATYDSTTKQLTIKENMTGDVSMKLSTVYTIKTFGVTA